MFRNKQSTTEKDAALQKPIDLSAAATKNAKDSSCSATAVKEAGNTQIIVHYDIGFGNTLYLRGEGAGLSWEEGIPMHNVDAHTWTWESNRHFIHCTFKVVINDEIFEKGEDHNVTCHEKIEYSPCF